MAKVEHLCALYGGYKYTEGIGWKLAARAENIKCLKYYMRMHLSNLYLNVLHVQTILKSITEGTVLRKNGKDRIFILSKVRKKEIQEHK